MLSLFAGVTGAFAYEAGDYVYTLNGRFQVSGDNLVTNGDFSDGTNGWTNTAGGALSTDTFTVDPGLGPDGENSLYVAASGAVDAGVLGNGSARKQRALRQLPVSLLLFDTRSERDRNQEREPNLEIRDLPRRGRLV